MKKLQKKGGELDLSNMRDIFTHSFHQERYIELLVRAIEDNLEDINSLQIRLINDQSYYDKFNTLGIKLMHFKRLLIQIPDNQVTKLHLNLTDVTT